MTDNIQSIFLSEDRQRRAEVYEKSGVWYVNLIVGEQLVEARPMVSDGGVVHNQRYAEDAAENWVLGIIQTEENKE